MKAIEKRQLQLIFNKVNEQVHKCNEKFLNEKAKKENEQNVEMRNFAQEQNWRYTELSELIKEILDNN